MKTIVRNKYNLTEKQMTEVVKRVKILLINSKNEILLAHSHNDYQFPGGHVEDGESLVETVNREVREETGIELNIQNIEPFAVSNGYYKDWPSEGKNRKIEIYYFKIVTDEKPNLDNTEYTDNEKDGNFKLKYIKLTNMRDVLKNKIDKGEDKKGIASEMLELFELCKDEIFNSNR